MTMHGRRAQQINQSCFQLLSPLSTVIFILSGEKKTFLYRSKNDLKKDILLIQITETNTNTQALFKGGK